MEKELVKIFNKAKYKENDNLVEDIWFNINRREQRISRIKLYISSFIGILSLASFIPAWNILSSDLSQSGIFEYISLAFSNSGLVLSYWKEFTLSIVESIPTGSIVLSLSLIFTLFISIKYATKQIIRSNLSSVGPLTLSF
ncbi:MAG: hypothetical protein NDI62_00775 [Burkholderiales bacterium]|nr:hypothetical protein [Burkholderiales bacterium]